MKPKLHPDVDIARIGPQTYLVTSPTRERFEAGAPDHFLLTLMDGEHEVDEICEGFRRQFGSDLSRRSLREFLNQLDHAGVLSSSEKPAAAVAAVAPSLPQAPPEPLSRSDRGTTLNHCFDLMVVLFGWLLHPVWIPLVAILAAMSLTGLIVRFDVLVAEIGFAVHDLAAPIIILAVPIKLIFIDLPRALLLGMACRKFGGRVRRFSVRLHRGLLPVAVCDVGDSPARMTGPQRWAIATAGLFAQTAIAALATICWQLARLDSPVRLVFMILAIVSWVGLVFRMNIFAPLDGYRILLELTGVPRLHDRARAEAMAWITLGTSPEALPEHQRFWFRAYGIVSMLLSSLFRAAIIVAGAWWLTTRYDGLGAVIAVFLCLVWYHRPIKDHLMQYSAVQWIVRGGGKWWIRWPIRLVVLGGIVALGFVPYSHEILGECRLIPEAQQGIRSQITDEIVEIHVATGDWVQAGQVIATLSGREILGAIKSKEAQLERARATLDLLEAGERAEDIEVAALEVKRLEVDLEYYGKQVERAERLRDVDTLSEVNRETVRREFDTTREQLAIARQRLLRAQNGSRPEEIEEARREVERIEADLEYFYGQRSLLEISSPIEGRIATAYLREREGQVAERGELIATVVDPTRMKVEIAADEAAAALVEPGMAVKVRLKGLEGRLLAGRVEQVDYVAARDRDFEAEPVRTDREVLLEQSGERAREFHLRVLATLEDAPDGLAPWMTGFGRIVIREETFGQALARPLIRFFRTEVWSWLP